MLKYIIRRTLLIIPILLAVIFIVSFIMELTPGTPGRVLLGPVATQEEVDKLDQKLGTDRPFLERYVDYVKNIVLHFDFGNSHTQQFSSQIAPYSVQLTSAKPLPPLSDNGNSHQAAPALNLDNPLVHVT